MDKKDNKICVYAIAKNEAKFVKKWYDSMKEADCVVVLDTGSTDNTVELLKEVGVDIVVSKPIVPWRFDTGRNESLKLVPEGYNILVCTDLDEIFEPGWAKILRDRWDDDKYERAEYAYVWSHHSNGKSDVIFPYNKIHNRNWVWRTPVHEYLTRKDNETNFYYERDKALNLLHDVTLHHYPDKDKSRSSYLDLLEIRYKEYPDDLMSGLYLAREYWFYKKYQDTIDTLKTIIDDHVHFNKTITAYMYYLTGCSYCGLADEATDKENKQGYILLAEKALSAGIDYNPEYLENYTKLGEIYTLYEYYEEAIKLIQMGIKNAKRQYSWVELGSNWTIAPLSVMGAAYYYLAKKTNNVNYKEKAIAYFAKALTYEPTNDFMKKNLSEAVKDFSINDLKMV
ncbi:MAG: glycosyltransferase [Acholeplasmatales bacterium]|nr:glycosyltransferase [Acholeplasmatales bacterium]